MADNNDLFASVISDIKTYTGKDPLLPWLRGIRNMKDSLPPQLLNQKLPRFLQKCTQTFESDRRYRNDLRYLRVWLQLMDFVDDPKSLLGFMESNRIGTKHSLFYQAYALYYEKNKKFDEAEKMYHLGVQNLAEPIDEIQKSYEKFLRRMERHKNQRIQRLAKTTNRHLSARNVLPNDSETEENNQMPPHEKDRKTKQAAERGSDKPKMFSGDDTVVVKFVDTALVGKSEAEDACHHGLVDPTINMKEAMNAINSMFSEPLETAPVGKSCQRRIKNDGNPDNGFQVFVDDNLDGNPDNGFQVFVDDNLDKGIKLADRKEEKSGRIENHQLHQEPFSIYVDNEENDKVEHENLSEDNFDRSNFRNSREDHRSASHANAFVFPSPNDLPSESSDDMDIEGSHRPRFREDTVVCRFVGSAILDEPEVENVCHHGLVDPTINLKEAMDDINNMFGKPMDFVRTRRAKKQEKAPTTKNDFGGFTILPDEDLEHEPVKPMPKSSGKSRDCDLFEPTLVTKEAFDDINKMFGMPLDF